MKAIVFILKLVFAPVWMPLWVVKKFWKLLLVALVVTTAAGCVNNTAKLDKSPCACTMTPFVTPASEDKTNV
jgi:hypothetical protein